MPSLWLDLATAHPACSPQLTWRVRIQKFIQIRVRTNVECASFSRNFSFLEASGSNATPESPGQIQKAGKLANTASHAFGARFKNPDLLLAVVLGNGKSETGPWPTAWHSNKFLNPTQNGRC